MRHNIDRRAFLKASANSLAALALAPRSFAESFQIAPVFAPPPKSMPQSEHFSLGPSLIEGDFAG